MTAPTHAPPRRTEWLALLAAAGGYFCLLCGYYMLRPLREALALEIGPDHYRALFTVAFVFCAALLPLYWWLVGRTPRGRLPWLVYVGSGVLAWTAGKMMVEDPYFHSFVGEVYRLDLILPGLLTAAVLVGVSGGASNGLLLVGVGSACSALGAGDTDPPSGGPSGAGGVRK